MPIIPTVLINGAEGIGTGWSTSVPNYNPKDIVANIRKLLNGEEMDKMHPWYRGFAGTIQDITKSKGGVEPDSRSYSCTGVISQTSDTTLEITELPVRKWTQDYKEWLETLIKPEDKNETPLLVDYKESHTDQKVHFIIEVQPNKMQECLAEGLLTKFKLTSKFATSNMVLFDMEGKIRHYSSPEEIIREFYTARLDYYEKRRQALIKVATADMVRLNNMVRFIVSVINGTLKVSNRKKAEVLADLQSQGYAKQNAGKKAKAGEEEETEEGEEEEEGGETVKGYNYLLSMPIWSLTLERVQKLQAEADHQSRIVQELTNTTNRQMWLKDLDAFVVAYDEWEQELADLEAKQVKQIKAGRGKAGAKGKAVKKAVKSKKGGRGDDSEEEGISSEEEEDEDFEMVPKAKPVKKVAPAPKPAPHAAPKPSSSIASASVSIQSKIAAAPAPAVSASVSAEPLSLAARLAGRLQLNSGPAAPPPAPVAASSYDLDDEITSPVSKPKAKAPAKPKAVADAKPKAKPAPKRRAKSASSDEDDLDDESEVEDDDDDDVYELDAMSPEVAHKGKKGRVGPSPAHMKKALSKTSAAPVSKPKASAAPAAVKPAPAPAAKKAAAPPKKKKSKDDSDDEEDDEESEIEEVAVDRTKRERRPAAAAKPRISYVEIDDDDEDQDDDDDDDFEASDEDDD